VEPHTIDELGNGTLEVWELGASEDFLNWLLTDLFENHERIVEEHR
jgi:hypothetical protein